jgi:3-deoxy-D-manno-octulosonic-acid transferase
LYTIFGTVVFGFLQLLAPVASRMGGRFFYRLDERFGHYVSTIQALPTDAGLQRIWIHAASVGEVLAAVNLIAELEREGSYRFFVTVMTEQGHRLGEKKT